MENENPVCYPGPAPGCVESAIGEGQALLENEAIRCEWCLENGRLKQLCVTHRHTGQALRLASAGLPRLALSGGQEMDLANESPSQEVQLESNAITAHWQRDDLGVLVRWSATLEHSANAVVIDVELSATRDVHIEDLVYIDSVLEGARQIGEVAGSVVVSENIFLGAEHPLAVNRVDEDGNVRCALPLSAHLVPGQTVSYSFAMGVVPSGQLRRGFLYYMEQRRIHPYRPFLHYNNWYDVWLARSTERITEPECMETQEWYIRELVQKRGVTLDAFVWDDGWDDFNTLWGFHKAFPKGFKPLDEAASKHGIAQGVWMSPNGGYATAKASRIAYGEPLGYETNDNGYAMGGPQYRDAYRQVCLKMMREHGVVFFKFDGMGEGGSGSGHTSGAGGALSNDIHAILELSRELHREQPDVYVSATAGTWASPYWLLYVDSVWRQGMDSGHHGAGDTRQQWITYRDKWTYDRVVQAGPLYPLNSLMLHGVLIGDRPNRAPSGMAFDEKSVADEIWSFFGSGTCLQELYVSPDVPSDSMLDHLAAAAKWSRANSDVLVDTHWVGGNPGEGEVYGWASWRPGKGILVLRNPAEAAQTFTTVPARALELPSGAEEKATLRAVYPEHVELPAYLGMQEPFDITLQPFETLVMELNA